MKSGMVKQKWTPEEEAALRAGVEKYGAGKWRAIQKDNNYGACLISRSNVDLKDKWRNMSVSANGMGSREKAARLLATKMKQVGTSSSQGDSGVTLIDTLSVTHAAKDKKHLGARLDNLVLETISNFKDTTGGSKDQIATYIESHYPVPSNFRRLLAAKLKDLTQQGKLSKMRQIYSIAHDLALAEEAYEQQSFQDFARKQAPVHSNLQESEEIAWKFKSMDAEEVVMVAAQAVADAEAAAAAAEEAAKLAEIAEAEWEAAEAAAEMAVALATGSARSLSLMSSRRGTSAVPV